MLLLGSRGLVAMLGSPKSVPRKKLSNPLTVTGLLNTPEGDDTKLSGCMAIEFGRSDSDLFTN